MSFVFNQWFKMHGSNGYGSLTTISPSPRFYAPCAQVSRRLGAGVPLTILRFVPVRSCIRDWVFALKRACEPGLFKEGANCRTRDNKLEEGDFEEA